MRARRLALYFVAWTAAGLFFFSQDIDAFLRVHRSIIVRFERIAELQPAGHGEYLITLRSGATVRSGRTYHDRLKTLADNPF